jgi:hypothetical protein
MSALNELDSHLVTALRERIKANARGRAGEELTCPVCEDQVTAKRLVAHYDRNHAQWLESLLPPSNQDVVQITGVDHARPLSIILVVGTVLAVVMMAVAPFLVEGSPALRQIVSSVVGVLFLIALVGVILLFDRFKGALELRSRQLQLRRWPGVARRFEPPFELVGVSRLRWSIGRVAGLEFHKDAVKTGGICLGLRSKTGRIAVSCREVSMAGFERRWPSGTREGTRRRTRGWPTACRLGKADWFLMEAWLSREGVLESTVPIERIRAYVA